MKHHSLELEVLVERQSQKQFWLDVDEESKRWEKTRFGYMLGMRSEEPPPFVIKTGRTCERTPGDYAHHCLLICDNEGNLDEEALGATLQAYLRVFKYHKGLPRFAFEWPTRSGGAAMSVQRNSIEFCSTRDILSRWNREGR